VVEFLLDRGADIEAKDSQGFRSLHNASHEGFVEVVECLLDRGAHVDAWIRPGLTPFLAASKLGHRDVAECLLQRGADRHAEDKWNTRKR
jgi:ankyrin repeat protein